MALSAKFALPNTLKHASNAFGRHQPQIDSVFFFKYSTSLLIRWDKIRYQIEWIQQKIQANLLVQSVEL